MGSRAAQGIALGQLGFWQLFADAKVAKDHSKKPS